MRNYALVFCCFLAAVVVDPMARAQDCNAILEHGIFDKTTTDSLRIRTQTLINWLSQTEFKSFAEARDAGLKVGFPIDGIPIEIGGYSRDNEWRQYQASLQTLDLSDTKVVEEFHQTVNAADQAIVNAWQTCVLNLKGISHAVIEMSDDPKKFTLLLDYDPVGEPYKARILDFKLKPASALCEPSISTYWFWHDDIPSGGRILNCSRQASTDSIQATGNTAKGPISAKLPGIVPAVAPPAKTWHTEDREGHPYVEYWSPPMDPNCTRHPDRLTPKHRCDFQHTQLHIGDSHDPFDTWNLYMDAPGPVYEVGCRHTGQNEMDDRGIPEGKTGHCTGHINGGDAEIEMYVKWKQLW